MTDELYSIREVQNALDISRIDFEHLIFPNTSWSEILKGGLYGGARDKHELILIAPDTYDILYASSYRTFCDHFVIGFSVHSSAFVRVANNEGGRTFIHPRYYEMLRRNDREVKYPVFYNKPLEPTLHVDSMVVTEDGRMYARHSNDFPSKYPSNESGLNILGFLGTLTDKYRISKEVKEALLTDLAQTALRTNEHVWYKDEHWGSRFRLFHYMDQNYILSVSDDKVVGIYVLTENAHGKITVLPVDLDKQTRLREAALKEIEKQ